MTSRAANSMLSGAVLRPAGGNVFEVTVEQLATAIRLGVFVDGEQLPPERELAEQLAISRNTLRDAIAALRDARLVTTKRGRGGGTVVTYAGPPDPRPTRAASSRGPMPLTRRVLHPVGEPPSTEQVWDTLEYRRVVEPGAAYVAATKALTGEQRAWLTAALRDTVEANTSGAHRITDSRLHLAIATLTQSPMLVEAVTRAQSALHELLAAIPVLPRNIAHSHDQHAVIVEAILTGQADQARTAMEEHCDATAALLRGLLG